MINRVLQIVKLTHNVFKLKNLKLCFKFFLVFQFVLTSLPLSATEIKRPSDLTHSQIDELYKIYENQKSENQGRQALLQSSLIDYLDIYNLLNQTVRVKKEGQDSFTLLSNKDYLYDLKRDSLFEKAVNKITLEKDQKNQIYIEGSFDELPVVRQYIAGIGNIVDFIEDLQFGMILTNKGLYVVDRNMGVNLVGRSPIPLAQIPLSLSAKDLKNIEMKFISPNQEIKDYTFSEDVKEQLESKSQSKKIVVRSGDLILTKGTEIISYIERDKIAESLIESYKYIDLTLVLKDVLGQAIKNPVEVSEVFKNLTPKDEKIHALLENSLGGGINHLKRFGNLFKEYLNHLEEVQVLSPNYISTESTFEVLEPDRQTIKDKIIGYLKSYGPLAFVGLGGVLFLGIPDTTVGTNAFGTYAYSLMTLGAVFVAGPLGFTYIYEFALNQFSKIPKKLDTQSAFNDFIVNLGRKAREQKLKIEGALSRSEKESWIVKRWVVLFPTLQLVGATLSFPFWERGIDAYYRLKRQPYVNYFRSKGYSIKEIKSATAQMNIEPSFVNNPRTIERIQQALTRYKESKAQLEGTVNQIIYSLHSDESVNKKKITKQSVLEFAKKMKNNPSLSKQILWVKALLDFELDNLLSKNVTAEEISKRIEHYIQEYQNLSTDQNRIQFLLKKAPVEIRKILKKTLNIVISKPKEVHNFLMNNKTPFHAQRSGKEYLTAQLFVISMTPYISERSNEGGIFNAGIAQLDPRSLSGTSEQGFADIFGNANLGLFLASMMLALSLKPDTSIKKLQESVNKEYSHQSEIGKKQSWFEHVFNRFKYLIQWGIEGSIGEVVIKREKVMYFIGWQAVFLFFIIPRVFSGQLSLIESAVSFVIFNGYALLNYRWFWGWVSGSAQYVNSQLDYNQKKVNEISTELDRIRTGAWLKNKTDLKNSIHQIQIHVNSIYGERSSVAQQVKNILQAETPQEKKANLIESILQEKPPSTKIHSEMDWTATAFLGPVMTIILAVPLLVSTFDFDFLTLSNFFSSIGVYTGTIGAFFLTTKPLIKDRVLSDGSIKRSWKNLILEALQTLKSVDWKNVSEKAKTSAKNVGSKATDLVSDPFNQIVSLTESTTEGENLKIKKSSILDRVKNGLNNLSSMGTDIVSFSSNPNTLPTEESEKPTESDSKVASKNKNSDRSKGETKKMAKKVEKKTAKNSKAQESKKTAESVLVTSRNKSASVRAKNVATNGVAKSAKKKVAKRASKKPPKSVSRSIRPASTRLETPRTTSSSSGSEESPLCKNKF